MIGSCVDIGLCVVFECIEQFLVYVVEVVVVYDEYVVVWMCGFDYCFYQQMQIVECVCVVVEWCKCFGEILVECVVFGWCVVVEYEIGIGEVCW